MCLAVPPLSSLLRLHWRVTAPYEIWSKNTCSHIAGSPPHKKCGQMVSSSAHRMPPLSSPLSWRRPHGGVCTEASAWRCLHGHVWTEMSIRLQMSITSGLSLAIKTSDVHNNVTLICNQTSDVHTNVILICNQVSDVRNSATLVYNHL